MIGFHRLFRPALSPEIKGRLRHWRQLPVPNPAGAWDKMPITVVDVETTGLNPHHDRLLSIGAVIMQGRAVKVGNLFHGFVRQENPGPRKNVLVHGITHFMQKEGGPPAVSLMDFLDFVGKAPLVAFHAPFDRAFLIRAIRKHLGVRFSNPFMDLAWLLPGLFPKPEPPPQGLDEWLARFRISVANRHSAEQDALVTAELLLVALAAANKKGLTTFKALADFASDEEKVSAYPRKM